MNFYWNEYIKLEREDIMYIYTYIYSSKFFKRVLNRHTNDSILLLLIIEL